MSLSSCRMDFDSTSSPSPLQHKSVHTESNYATCQYHRGRYCRSKICTIDMLLICTTLAGIILLSLALWFDNWAGVSTNPYSTLKMDYPRLGSKHLDYVMFNKTIPNDKGTLYKYIDDGREDVRFMTSRYGLLSQCRIPVQGPKIALFKTPWKAPVCKASWGEYQCPIVAMRVVHNAPAKSPKSLSAPRAINGCIKSSQRCDGVIDCPTGHDELNCAQPEVSCGPGMIQCSANKPICILKNQVCDGINHCGMYEDEQNCCGRIGFIRCGDGSCLLGSRCDAIADCFDSSDEYDCPDPASKFYEKCKDGQLIQSTYMCEKKEYPSFQCRDLSDETECDFNPTPLAQNPAMKSLRYDKQDECFEQLFTLQQLNQTMMDLNYPDKKRQEFANTYEYSTTKIVVIASIGLSGLLGVISVLLLVAFPYLNKRCQGMRRMFIGLAVVYFLCIVQTLVTGIYWVKYVKALNDIMENPDSSDIYDEVAIETVQVTGGLATIRISTQLTFYNCGFYGLALILCLIAARLLKSSSCPTATSMHIINKRHLYSDDQLTTNDPLLSAGTSSNNSGDNGVPTPDQVVTPHRSIRSYDANLLLARSNATLPARFYSHGRLDGHNTYVSYNNTDSIETIDKPKPLHVVTTLDRHTYRSTPV
ncbi:uncharacterized protein [Watersipora subatra]|uniref:uncharacterized protein n=1 Tax=Watersipora subatra TaxID=2589382 RepID=UPI00355C7814